MRTVVQKFDDHFTKVIQALPQTWRGYFKQMTLIGQPIFALVAAAAVSYYGEYTDDWRLVIAGMTVALALLLASSLKFALRRKRPLTDYVAAMFFKTYSFPSGHAAASASCYGLVVYLCITSGDSLLIATGIVLIPLIVSIGISRVYLGAHFPSDIIGGWIFGAVGLGLAIWILQP